MTPDELDPLAETAPLALLYHENSKITRASGVYMSEAVAEFSDDPDELRRLASSHKTCATSQRIKLGSLHRRPRPRGALDRILASRRSTRRFGTQPVDIEVIASLLTHSMSVTSRLAHPQDPDIVQPVRAAPSGGALYPVELYLAAANVEGADESIYHYQPVDQVLEDLQLRELQACRDAIVWPAPEMAQAPALIILTGRWLRPLSKYGERGYRILLLDAGHVAQNLLLVATALGLSACPIASFHDDALAGSLQLDLQHEPPLYVIALGWPP